MVEGANFMGKLWEKLWEKYGKKSFTLFYIKNEKNLEKSRLSYAFLRYFTRFRTAENGTITNSKKPNKLKVYKGFVSAENGLWEMYGKNL